MTPHRRQPESLPLADRWDLRLGASISLIQPGEIAVTGQRDKAFETLLGSCVSACICDPKTGIGGLNHFLLPDDGAGRGQPASATTEFGIHAMDMLIGTILKRGGCKARMRAKLFGGATMRAMGGDDAIGRCNGDFALKFLRREGIEVTGSDLGGEHARRIVFQPATNRVLVQTAGLCDLSRIAGARARLLHGLDMTVTIAEGQRS